MAQNDTLKITLESTDGQIKYGVDTSLLGDEDAFWRTVFIGGRDGVGGPGLITSEPQAPRMTMVENMITIVDFYGPMCTVIGYGYNFNMTATLDGELLDWTLPEENDERYPSLIDLRGLSPGPHSLLFNTNNRVDPEGISRITIERAYIDTGLTDLVPLNSYPGSSDVWSKSGDWQLKTLDTAGAIHSLRSTTRGDFLDIPGGINGPAVVFLYGSVGQEYGQILVHTQNRTQTGDAVPQLLTGAASASMRESLLYFGVVPEEGWRTFKVENSDVRKRTAEITRLDVYGREGAQAIGGVSTTSDSLSPQTTGNEPGPQVESNVEDGGGPSAAVVGGAIAAGLALLALLAALFFILRRRRQILSHHIPPPAGLDNMSEAGLTPSGPNQPVLSTQTANLAVLLGPATRRKGGMVILSAGEVTMGTASPSRDRVEAVDWAASSAPPDSSTASEAQSESSVAPLTCRVEETGDGTLPRYTET